jgi:hypothetical protein
VAPCSGIRVSGEDESPRTSEIKSPIIAPDHQNYEAILCIEQQL